LTAFFVCPFRIPSLREEYMVCSARRSGSCDGAEVWAKVGEPIGLMGRRAFLFMRPVFLSPAVHTTSRTLDQDIKPFPRYLPCSLSSDRAIGGDANSPDRELSGRVASPVPCILS